MEAVCQPRRPRAALRADRQPDHAASTRCSSSTPPASATPRLIDAAQRVRHDAGPVELLADRARCVRSTRIASTSQMVDARTRTWATALLDRPRVCPTRLLQPLVEPGARAWRAYATRVIQRYAGDAGGRAGVPRHRDPRLPPCRRDGGAFLSSGTWSLLGAEVAGADRHARRRAI